MTRQVFNNFFHQKLAGPPNLIRHQQTSSRLALAFEFFCQRTFYRTPFSFVHVGMTCFSEESTSKNWGRICLFSRSKNNESRGVKSFYKKVYSGFPSISREERFSELAFRCTKKENLPLFALKQDRVVRSRRSKRPTVQRGGGGQVEILCSCLWRLSKCWFVCLGL